MRKVGSELRTDLILWYTVEVSEGLLERVLSVPTTFAFPVKFALSVEFPSNLSQFPLSNLRKLGRLVQTELRFGVEEGHSLGVL